jgi:hypothetical protein
MADRSATLMDTLATLFQRTDGEVRTICQEQYLVLSAAHFRLKEYAQAKDCLAKFHALSPDAALRGDLLAIELGMNIVSGDHAEEQRLQSIAQTEGAYRDPSFAHFITQMKAIATFRKPDGQSS